MILWHSVLKTYFGFCARLDGNRLTICDVKFPVCGAEKHTLKTLILFFYVSHFFSFNFTTLSRLFIEELLEGARGVWWAWEVDRYPEHEGPKQMRTEQTFLKQYEFY